jgi:polyhydroxyalkanoate synthesis regulator phasin
LDAYAIAIERVAVQDEIGRIRTEWASLRSKTNKLSSMAAGMVRGIPTEPVSAWPPEVGPQIVMPSGSDWVQLRAHLARLRERLATLQAQPVPTASSDDSRARKELASSESQLAERERSAGALVGKIESDSSEVQALQKRIEGIEDDLRKYKDVRRLRKLGSSDELEVSKGVCPTCHQEMVDSLLETGRRTVPMSVDQNVSFYEEQLQLFSAVLANARLAIEASQMQLESQRSEIENLRNRIRELRDTLVSPSNMPSIESLGERIRLEDRIRILEGVLASFEDSLGEFGQLTVDWKNVQERRARLPRGALSESDENKINAFQQSFRQQLVLYSMGSLNPAEINISRDNYVPEASDINLTADVSGSDLIRLHWAYLMGLLELGLSVQTNHPGLLIMDDPQQQSVEEVPFRAMLKYAKSLNKAQIIIATSHERSIDEFLKTIGVTSVYEFGDNRLIDRI